MNDQAFSPKYDLARPATHRKTEKEGQLADGRGGEEPNYTTVSKPGPLYIIQYSLGSIQCTDKELGLTAALSYLGRKDILRKKFAES